MKICLYIVVILFNVQNNAFAQIPILNQKVIEYVDSKMGKKVDRGECWDLANKALEFAEADMPSIYVFGREYKIEPILPGDILQFSNVKAKYEEGNNIFFQTMTHHTAIVYKVLDEHTFILAEQNGAQGKKVSTITFSLKNKTSGKIKYFRPIPKSN